MCEQSPLPSPEMPPKKRANRRGKQPSGNVGRRNNTFTPPRVIKINYPIPDLPDVVPWKRNVGFTFQITPSFDIFNNADPSYTQINAAFLFHERWNTKSFQHVHLHSIKVWTVEAPKKNADNLPDEFDHAFLRLRENITGFIFKTVSYQKTESASVGFTYNTVDNFTPSGTGIVDICSNCTTLFVLINATFF